MTNGSTPKAPKPEAAPNNQGLKSLIAKGAVGAFTLAGTTAIPLMVQKYFSTPPASVPAVPSPVQVSPVAPPLISPVESSVASPLPSPILLPIQTQAEPNQAGVVKIRLGTDQADLMQVERDDEMNSKKPGTRKKQRKDDDDD